MRICKQGPVAEEFARHYSSLLLISNVYSWWLCWPCYVDAALCLSFLSVLVMLLHCRRYPRWRSFGEHKLHLCFSLALQAPFSGVWSVVRQMLRSGHLRWPCSWLQRFDCGYTHKVPSSTHKTRAYAREMHRELRQLKIMKHGPLFLPPSTRTSR